MRKKILIVDDNSELLELLRLGLKEAGFTVATATNGFDALEKARSLTPDVIVLDLVLPELDGFAACETLKTAAETAHIPIIVLTGLTSEFTRFAGLEAGADEYVMKPVTPAELVSRIECCLARAPRPAAPARRVMPDPRKRAAVSPIEGAHREDGRTNRGRVACAGKGQGKIFA